MMDGRERLREEDWGRKIVGEEECGKKIVGGLSNQVLFSATEFAPSKGTGEVEGKEGKKRRL